MEFVRVHALCEPMECMSYIGGGSIPRHAKHLIMTLREQHCSHLTRWERHPYRIRLSLLRGLRLLVLSALPPPLLLLLLLLLLFMPLLILMFMMLPAWVSTPPFVLLLLELLCTPPLILPLLLPFIPSL
mmetsp:Transcript_48296/g.103113  ORF Transcript_48296/g.103113 Transcript_48296/m.103113 type:complete len:129 (-) Transcript_48296:348-734(-)